MGASGGGIGGRFEFSSVDDVPSGVFLYDDFFVSVPALVGTASFVGQLNWRTLVAGTGAGVDGATSLPFGLAWLTTGSTATGSVAIHLGLTGFEGAPVFVAEWRAAIDTLNSGGTQEKTVYIGLHDSTGSPEPTDGMYFKYSSVTANWQCKVAGGGVSTTVGSGVAANTAYHRFRITSDGAGAVRFYIDDVLVATIADANVPVNGEQWTPCAVIAKTVGVTAHALACDYFALDLEPAGR